MLIDDVCSDVPNALWHRKKHIVDLPYVKDFDKKNIPTKARPIQMNTETVEFAKKKSMICCRKNWLGIASPPGLVQLFMSKKMMRLKEEPQD